MSHQLAGLRDKSQHTLVILYHGPRVTSHSPPSLNARNAVQQRHQSNWQNNRFSCGGMWGRMVGGMCR